MRPKDVKATTRLKAGVLEDRVSSYVEELFEERLGGRGFNLHDTGVLAATLEHLIHDENKDRLTKAYDVQKISSSNEITRAQADAVLDEYMKLHLLSDDMASKVKNTEAMKQIFPGLLISSSSACRTCQRRIEPSRRWPMILGECNLNNLPLLGPFRSQRAYDDIA